MTTMRDKLLKDIEEYLSETGTGPEYFGRKAGASANIVGRLRAGRDVHTRTYETVRNFISEWRHQRVMTLAPIVFGEDAAAQAEFGRRVAGRATFIKSIFDGARYPPDTIKSALDHLKAERERRIAA